MDRTLKGDNSFFKGKGPAGCPRSAFLKSLDVPASTEKNAKSILDSEGPEALAKWVRENSGDRVLLTDTTMRDAHQSHFATRMRTSDMLKGADEMSKICHDYFSLECW